MARRGLLKGKTIGFDATLLNRSSPRGAGELRFRRGLLEHDALRKKMGITQEQDEEWQRTHETPAETRVKGAKSVNPFAVGGGFLAWCVQQGWLIQRGRQYFATTEGARELRERLGIKL